jgi:DNA-binding CsgD family transcriptional regulator
MEVQTSRLLKRGTSKESVCYVIGITENTFRAIIRELTKRAERLKELLSTVRLSHRESQVLTLLARGLPRKEVCTVLQISSPHFSGILGRLREKFGLSKRGKRHE